MHPTEARKCKGDLGCGQYNSGREVLRATNTWWQNEQRKIQINKIKVSEKMFKLGWKIHVGSEGCLDKICHPSHSNICNGSFQTAQEYVRNFFKKNVGALSIIKW
jgi:hypothetical protein